MTKDSSGTLADGTVPKGVGYKVNPDGTISIGNYVLSPSDYEALDAAVRASPSFQEATKKAPAKKG